MKIRNRHLRALRYIAPVFCSIAVLSSQVQAGPTIQLNGDESRDGMADSGNLGYVGGNTRIGVSIDRNLQGQVDVNQIIHEDDSSATSAEGWFGYKIKDDDDATKGFQGGGVKVNHQWINDEADAVHKVFGAYDRNTDDQAKATIGYGQETEDLFWSGHVSKGMGDEIVNGDITTRAYDYGVGGEVGTFFDSTLTRVRGGLDYEFGTEYADDEDRPGQLTVSAGVEQFFHDTPHSISLDVSGNRQQGGNDAEETDFNARLGYRYEFGGNGAYQSEQTTRRRRVEIPGTPGRPGRAGVPAIPATPAIAATPARPGRAAIPPKYERRAVQTPGHEFVKTTMKLENETFFKLNSSALTDSAKRNLDKIVSQIRGHGYLGAIRITGNTCGMGDPVYDQRLSENRANAVRAYLVDQGFNPDHLVARGLGKGSPKYDRNDNDFKNRRVDLEYVTERSIRKANNKTQYKNVLVQEGRPAIPAQPARPGRAGHPGRPAIPAIAATPGTPSRFVWKTEVVKSAPIWIKRALRNTIKHNKTISTYTTRTAQEVKNDTFIMDSRDGLIDVLSNDSAGVTLVRVSQPANGTVVIEGNKVRYIPNPGYSGSDSFTYTVTDRDGNEITATVNVDVPVAMNNAPAVNDDAVSTNEGTMVPIPVLENDTDTDGDTLSIESTSNPSNGSVHVEGDEIEYTPNTGFVGVDKFTYTVNDGNGNLSTATVTVTVSNVNEAPKATDDAVTTPENTPVTVTVLDNDSDPDGDSLTITDATDPADGSVSIVGGEIVYTPNTDYFGTDSFTYTITDGQDHEVTANVDINVTDVNVAPTAGDDMRTTPENTKVTISVLDNDSDPDGDSLTITDTTDPANGSVSTVGDDIVYTPDTDYSGSDSFQYTISDGQGHEVTATVNIEITDINMAPDAVDDSEHTDQDSPVTISVLGNDTDPDGDSLSITDTTTPLNGTVRISGNDIIYTPNLGYNGTDIFDYTITDGEGNQDTASVVVTAVNQAPKLTNDIESTEEDTAVTIDVTANDTDPEDDTLTVMSTTDPSNGSVSISGNNVVYTPASGYVGVDSFTYTVNDGNGNTETANVNMTVTGVNLPPEAMDDTATTDYETAVTIPVAANDTDPEGGSTCVSAIATGPTSGWVEIASNGVDIVYTPFDGFSGSDSFSYVACDSEGNTSVATVSVTVGANSNLPPTLSPNYAAIQGYGSVPIRVLEDDTDPEGDTLTIVKIENGPSNGTATIDGDRIYYQPDDGFVGSDSFYYVVNDGNGNEGSARVEVDVKNDIIENRDPVIGTIPAFDAATGSTTPLDISSYITDADGDTVYIAAADALRGSLTFNGFTLQYTPAEAKSDETDETDETDTIYITVSDGNGGMADSVITVNVL